ncbi:hypothetical protein [Corynebacterium sp. A21]|uniref:hypothetical protein n=1 Tax=Corynebacterium sp. A21 TaxID=3457318 RepID=UPI003FD69E6B
MTSAHPLDTTLTVFLGRGNLSQGIRQTLEDFTATGLIRDLVWVDADSFRNSSSEVTHLRVTPAGTPEITRKSFTSLVSHSGTKRMNLGVINVVGAPDSALTWAEIDPLTKAIGSFSVGRDIHRTNLMITAVGSPLVGDLPILRGYTNLLLAPEDSPGPDTSTVAYHFDDLDSRFTLHCVAGIASLFGIWEGSSSAPVTQLAANNGASFRLVRSFYRRIDGQAVQASLKARILDTDTNPLPRLDRPGRELTAQHTQNPAAFAAAAAEKLLIDFEEKLVGTRVEPTAEKTRRTSTGAAIREFLGRWAKNMMSGPRRAGRDLRAESGALVEDTVQATLYGETGSRTQVGGSPLNDAPLSPVFGGSNASRVQVDQELQAAAELQQVWDAYKNVAMSLLDAAPRQIAQGEARLPQVVNNGTSPNVTVARRAADVIPGPDSNFGSELPFAIRAALDGSEVAPYDVVGVQQYEQRLASDGQVNKRQVGQVIGDFQQWQARNSESFAFFTGRGLQRKLKHEQQRERELHDEIRRLEREKNEDETSGLMGKVFRWLGWVSFWSAALFAGLWAVINLRAGANADLVLWVRHLNDAEPATKAKLFGIWLLIWLICWILQGVGETLDGLRFSHRRTAVDSRLAAAKENLIRTHDAIIRLNVGYQQFLSTSQIIGTLLERPFGKIRHTQVDAAIPVNTMPASVVFAEATPDDHTVDQLALRFRKEIFSEGWLQDYVNGGMQTAAADFASDIHNPIDVDHVFSTTGQGSSGELARFAEWIIGDRFRSRDRSAAKWSSITGDLARDARHEGAEVLTSLQFYRAGQKISAPNRAPLEHNRFQGFFNSEIASESGQVGGVLQLDTAFCTHERHPNTFDAIGVSEVLVQIGHSADQSDVAFTNPEAQSSRPEIIDQMPTEENHQAPDSGLDTRPYSPESDPRDQQMPGMGEF